MMTKPPSSFSARCRRTLRHWRTTKAAGRRAFPPQTLAAIEAAIGHGELTHGAEVRLIVENSLDAAAIFEDITTRQRALILFAEYGVWDTEENCGVLIYVNLADREVEIVADRNVNRRISSQQWQELCRTMTEGFAHAAFHESTLAAIARLNDLLRQHFPDSSVQPNQLPNQPIVL
jgi:uncharacterized membrane protein